MHMFSAKTCLCKIYPLKHHVCIEKTRVCRVIPISDAKQRLWVLVRTASKRQFYHVHTII